jgi:hypothetical protein
MAVPALGIMGAMGVQSLSTIIGVIIGQTLSPLLSPIADAGGQLAYRLLPTKVIPLAEAIEARYRGIVDAEQFSFEVQSQGFKPQRANWLYQVSENLLGTMELINLYRRGELSLDGLYTEAGKLKWTKERLDALLKVTQVIPTASDIITFAVREVYTPEVAEAFGQYEGADEVYDIAKSDIEAIGMTQETFTKYWAAHWQLPSLGQGFEMLHRGVIPFKATPNEPLSLERLMIALDIMPAWREKLTEISYAPYTRVDVRRMHKLGIISDNELIRSYMDLGYDEEKAKRMAEFTILYNAEPESSEETQSDKSRVTDRDLTKTDILNGYRDALINEYETRDALKALGYDDTETDFYISRINFNRERDEVDTYLKYYHDAYVKGVMTHNEIVDKLGELSLSGDRINYLFRIWDLERMSRTNKPTKAELNTFLRKKVIDRETYIEEMKGLGYSERYINWYLRTV